MGVAEQMTKAGDLWRSSAVQMAGIYKGRLTFKGKKLKHHL